MKLFAMFTVCLLACKSTKPEGGQAKTTEETAAAAAAGDSPTDALSKKLNGYVHCLNDFTNDVFKGRHTWLDQFDPTKGPQAKQAASSLYGPLKLPEIEKCKTEVAAAKAMQPSMPALEKAGEAYVAAIAELQPLTVRLRAYFEQGNYKDDKLALAIELHPKLMDAYAKFRPANESLGNEVDKLEDRLAGEQLAELEKTEGKQLLWHHKKMLIDAKKLVGFAGVGSPADIKDPAALQAAVAAFDTSVTALLDYYAKHKDAIEKKSMSYWTIESSLKTFLVDAKNLMRRNRDKQAFSSGEQMTINANNPQAVDGHPARVIASYNSVIDTSNRMRF